LKVLGQGATALASALKGNHSLTELQLKCKYIVVGELLQDCKIENVNPISVTNVLQTRTGGVYIFIFKKVVLKSHKIEIASYGRARESSRYLE